ncbi:unnamed protein product [Psylliodes chrysocephalus]|uniref:Glutamate--cysteine ligase n=1 Tax=Psylliodes chrysocephalus TaxID=3402493 RepID=A0A9P0CGJ0_9CUCU|nr:unnamed protein product [Psylliodes chrysocephala]
MGLADAGSPLSHEETMKWASHIRKHGIVQFINLFKKQKTRRGDVFKWGEEIEYTIVKFDDDKREVKLNLKGEELLKELNINGSDGFWAPEYGAFMIEGTPAQPFEGLDFSCVEENMRKRRKEVKKLLKSDEDLICITSFPRMGCENFTYPIAKPTPIDGITKSIFFPDACIFPGHSRYKNTTKNIMARRGEKPFYNLQVFKDKKTKNPLDDSYIYEKNALPDHVYLDSMGFGCGYSCLQTTFQASDLSEARVLYDQLASFCPIMMVLTASAPFHRGFITDVDARWNILCHTQDCRTPEEKGLRPLNKNKFVINKSRHDSIDCYISPEGKKFNDLEILFYEEDYKTLVDNGIDDLLAQHVAHLFIRDTISVFKEKIHQDDEEEIGHFENIQSTVWQTMRLKPPPPNTSIGWRVEFRPCDVQKMQPL